MTAERPRARFVPTLTEVVQPLEVSPAGGGQQPTVPEASAVVSPEPSVSRSSVLESAVDDLMPQAREQMRQKLHAAAYALADEQLQAMEDTLRQRLRTALREATGMGSRS